jgi:plastocyanin
MRAVSLILFLLAACGGSGSGDGSSSGGIPDAGADVVTIGWTLQAQNSPVTTTLAAGTPMRWRSGDGIAHTVVADGNPPPNAVSVPGGATTATQTITIPGSYPYHCGIHPAMHGTLVVQ